MSSSGEQKQKAAAAAKYQPGSHTSEGGLYLIGCDLPELMPRKKKSNKKNDGSRIGYSRFPPPESIQLTCYYYYSLCIFVFFLPLIPGVFLLHVSQLWAGGGVLYCCAFKPPTLLTSTNKELAD
jgi:hypothetical protein